MKEKGTRDVQWGNEKVDVGIFGMYLLKSLWSSADPACDLPDPK